MEKKEVLKYLMECMKAIHKKNAKKIDGVHIVITPQAKMSFLYINSPEEVEII